MLEQLSAVMVAKFP